jgi:hypothetical protein
MLELVLFEITTEGKKRHLGRKGGRGKKKVYLRYFFLILLFTKHQFFFPHSLIFQHIRNYINTRQKEYNRHHNETFSLQTKSITQILKIKKIATT